MGGTIAGISLLVGAGGLMVHGFIRDRLYAEFDLNLRAQVAQLAAMIEVEEARVKVDWLESENDPQVHLRGIDYYLVRRTDTGEVMAASPDLAAELLPRFHGSEGGAELQDIMLDREHHARCARIERDVRQSVRDEEGEVANSSVTTTTASAGAPPGLPIELIIIRVDTVAPALTALGWALFSLWVGCSVLGASVAWFVVSKELEPLNALGRQIARLREGTSGQRVDLPDPPRELEPVTRELNHLLERVEHVLVRERTLTSNVAHELRTPIAGLISTLEVSLNRWRSVEEYRDTTEECFEIVKQMHWLVTNLLSISRIEAGNISLQRQLVCLDSVLPRWWKPFEAKTADRGIRITWAIEPEATLKTDPEFLRVVVGNLFDNAASYTPSGGMIHIEARAGGQIRITNQATHLTENDSERVFDPFWRHSTSREAAGDHAGLGLTLCSKIVGLMGGSISARLRQPEGMFVVHLEIA